MREGPKILLRRDSLLSRLLLSVPPRAGYERCGWRLTGAVERLWAGERDLAALTADLDCNCHSAAVVAMILAADGASRARLHCRFVPALFHFIPGSQTYSVPLFLKRPCDRTLGASAAGWSCTCGKEHPGAHAFCDGCYQDRPAAEGVGDGATGPDPGLLIPAIAPGRPA